MLRTIKDTNHERALTDVIDLADKSGYPLPPEMENRPGAAELRGFVRIFQSIENSDDRRAIMDAVYAAADTED